MVPSAIASLSSSTAASRTIGRLAATSLAFIISLPSFSIFRWVSRGKDVFIRACSPPSSDNSLSIALIAKLSFSTISSKFITVRRSVLKAAVSCRILTLSITSAFLKLSGPGRASKSALMSSSKSVISSSVNSWISCSVSSWEASFALRISSRFSSKKLFFAS